MTTVYAPLSGATEKLRVTALTLVLTTSQITVSYVAESKT